MSFSTPAGATLVRALGAGSVFELAIVRYDGQECMCKRLRHRMLEEESAQRALEREGLALELLAHPAVPQLLARGADEWGAYVIESCLPGVTLRELVEGFRQRRQAVPAKVVERLVRDAFQALAEIHRLAGPDGPLDWVHGDLSPDQVLVSQSGQPFFVDFGQARWRGMAPLPGAAERGTLPFVSPEVARGEAVPDQAGDVFALAATLAFVLLGREPCRTSSPPARLVEVSERGVDLEALERIDGIDGAWRAALLAALRFDPAERLCRAAAVLQRLDG